MGPRPHPFTEPVRWSLHGPLKWATTGAGQGRDPRRGDGDMSIRNNGLGSRHALPNWPKQSARSRGWRCGAGLRTRLLPPYNMVIGAKASTPARFGRSNRPNCRVLWVAAQFEIQLVIRYGLFLWTAYNLLQRSKMMTGLFVIGLFQYVKLLKPGPGMWPSAIGDLRTSASWDFRPCDRHIKWRFLLDQRHPEPRGHDCARSISIPWRFLHRLPAPACAGCLNPTVGLQQIHAASGISKVEFAWTHGLPIWTRSMPWSSRGLAVWQSRLIRLRAYSLQRGWDQRSFRRHISMAPACPA